ncbi:MAG: hypothetical protein ACLU21_08950 [Angelakisella sp.]
MKKVLALVLAVIMVCTMAMAVDVITITGSDGTIVVSGSDTVATATIDNNKAIKSNTTYYLEVPEGFFKVLTDNGVNIGTKKYGEVFTVSGLNGGFNAADLSKYYVPVKVEDKALDGVADATLGTFTIKKDANNYASFKVVGNKFVLEKLVVGSLDKTAAATLTGDLYSKYDIGYLAEEVDSSTTVMADNKYNTWFHNDSNKPISINLGDGWTLKVPAKTYFQFEQADVTVPGSFGTGSALATTTVKSSKAYSVTGATLIYKLAATNGSNDVYYAYGLDSKIYNAGLKFVIEKDAVGTETGYWTLETTEYLYAIFTADKALATVGSAVETTPATPGTTTNPGTGANDVVGVAAALAVVALVSGAAISLKK